MMAALQPAATGIVTAQPRMIFHSRRQLTSAFERSHPTKTTEPTMQWVVLIGRPISEEMSTVNAVPRPIQNPLKCEKHPSILVFHQEKSLSSNGTRVERGAFSWRVRGDKFFRFSTRYSFCPCDLPLSQLRDFTKQGRSHGEWEGTNSSGFLLDARLAHATCHCLNSGTVSTEGNL